MGAFVQAKEIPNGYNTFEIGGLPVDVLVNDRGSNVTGFFFHGAVDATYRAPVIVGQGISRDVPINRIFIPDPTVLVSKDLNLGWYLGTQNVRTQPVIEDVIGKLLATSSGSRAFFFGSSGGGFASLYFSSFFPGSLSIALNPQTNILRHRKDTVEQFFQLAHDLEEGSIASAIPHSCHTDVIPFYSRRTSNTVAYIQNVRDRFHIKEHMHPFVKAVHPMNAVMYLQDDWGGDHTPPPKYVLSQLLQGVGVHPTWQSALFSQGFTSTNSIA
ncbi:hypothetical protein [Kocuria sp. UCD-OTCP]|uniref:hypothetical protein n=1 Tax=Kocuria sp. UCD-OTCP TaxID=1292021 RepID=UPI00167F85E7|nr:hypothetical protein [Kocuria sp. UCD-OTCP]